MSRQSLRKPSYVTLAPPRYLSGAGSCIVARMVAAEAARAGATRRRWGLAALLYLLLTAAYALTMPTQLWRTHTPFNHYALQADAWRAGRLDLPGPPPAYSGNNDFALYQGRHYISFPPVPAALIYPVVATSDSVEQVRDGRFFLWWAAIGPALLFLTLEALRRDGRTRGSEAGNLLLAALFGLGSVYWFSAVQGTVWFAGHVVSVALLCAYLLCSVRARFPLLAGLALALAVGTRPSLALAAPWFAFELWRVFEAREHATGPRGTRLLLRKGVPFVLALAAVATLLMLHNLARFDAPLEFGHRYLTVVWRERIDRWGLLSYHYLGRNLAVMLTGLPFRGPSGWQINGHGLALWITTPLYAWALWPRRASPSLWACALCAASIALFDLLYQNTGWLQFGYRFSNDFAPFLFIMIALGGRRRGVGFALLALWSVAINGFGAVSFGNPSYRQHYFIDPSQRILHQPD